MARKRLGEILIEAGVLDESRLRAALAEQRRWGGPLGRILVDMKIVTEEAMVQALSRQLNLPAVSLDAAAIPPDVLDLVPAEIAEQQSVIPFKRQGSFLDVAMADPTNLGIIDELRIRTHLNIHPYLAGPKAIERALSRLYGRGVGIPIGNEVEVPGAIAALGEPPVRLDIEPSGRVEVGPPGVAAAALGATVGPPTPAARRAQQAELYGPVGRPPDESREIQALQERVQHLEALVARDEDVLRKLLSLLIQKGVVTREEILERIK